MGNHLAQLNSNVWKEIVDKSPIATFYHTSIWTKIICETFPKWQNAAFELEFKDGNRAIFPMFRRSLIGSLPFYWYESTVPGAYGGPIFQSTACIENIESINRELLQYSNLLIASNPFSDWQPGAYFSKYETFIQTICLEPDFNKIWKRFSKGRRHTINYAKRQGVTVKEVNFLEYYQPYYRIYQTQLKRWGKKATDYYPMRLFENLAVSAQTNPEIKFWTAWLNEKMISGLIVFYHNKHLVTWHGATLEDYFEYRPVDILYSSVIENACSSGYEIFDFANSGGHQSVVEYKERFGAIRRPLTIYRRRNIGGIAYRAIRHLRNYLGKCPED